MKIAHVEDNQTPMYVSSMFARTAEQAITYATDGFKGSRTSTRLVVTEVVPAAYRGGFYVSFILVTTIADEDDEDLARLRAAVSLLGGMKAKD